MSGPKPSAPPNSARRACAALAFALAVVLSYTLQRLVDARTEPPMGTVILSATMPFAWRVGMALLHGLTFAALVGLGSTETQASRWLRHAPWLLPLLVLPAILAMVLVP